MQLKELIKANRSYRRFNEADRLTEAQLRSWVDLARLSPSGMNLQPLKYMLITEQETCDSIFPCFGWAGYLKEWSGPKRGERPAAYVIILGDKTIRPNFGIDAGIAAQSIMLGVVEDGFGGCMMGAIRRGVLAEKLDIPERFEILYALALGKPVETVVMEELEEGGDLRYYRDEDQVHHVPKRKLDDIIVK